jgi:hypothetical protein
MKKLLVAVILGASLFGFNIVYGVSNNTNTSLNYYNTYQFQGKVVKAYTQSGFGRRGVEWLFMDVQTDKGIIKVGIAPTFVMSNLPIKEGDIVKIEGITPPIWPKGTIRALDIYDVTQKKDYLIRGFGRGWRYREYYR